jgi:hypothetical protein
MGPGERASLRARVGALGAWAALPILAACSRAPLDAGTYAGDAAAGDDGPSSGGCVAPPAGAVRTVTTVGNSGVEPNGIAVWGTDVYWASVAWGSDAGPSGTGWLQTVSTAGGPVTILGTAQIPFGVAVDGTNVYWTSAADLDASPSTSAGLLRMTPRSGGATLVLATSVQGIGNIALGPTGVYWVATDGSLVRTPLGGGPAPTVVSPPAGGGISCFAVDESNVYWASGTAGNAPSSILKMPLAGGAPVTLASAVGCDALAVGSSFVAWGDQQGIQSVPIDGGATVTLFSGPSGSYASIAVDCGFVYWATGTQVMKAPVAGGPPTMLAPLVAGWGTATGFAFDATSLYFATQTPCAANPQLGCAVVEKVTPK